MGGPPEVSKEPLTSAEEVSFTSRMPLLASNIQAIKATNKSGNRKYRSTVTNLPQSIFLKICWMNEFSRLTKTCLLQEYGVQRAYTCTLCDDTSNAVFIELYNITTTLYDLLNIRRDV